MKSADFEALLDQCIARLADGESLDAILAEHPDEAEALQQLLPLAQAYQTARPPAASLTRRSQGKQAMLSAVEEMFPAAELSWWQRIWAGSNRSLVYAAGAVAALAIVVAAVLSIDAPSDTAVDLINPAPTQEIAVAMEEAAVEEPSARAEELAPAPTLPPPTATVAPTQTVEPTQEIRAGNFAAPETAADESESAALEPTAAPMGTGTPPGPAVVSPPEEEGGSTAVGGDSAGQATAPLSGSWVITSLLNQPLAVPILILFDQEATILVETACGTLQGSYSVDGMTIHFENISLIEAETCAENVEQIVSDLQGQLTLTASWQGDADTMISLLDYDGSVLVELVRE